MPVRLARLILPAVLLAGCSTGPNHVGNPLTLPGRAITNGISELSYKARRAKVKDFTRRNATQIHADIAAGGGANLTTAMTLACVEPDNRAALITELVSNPGLYRSDDIEPLVVALMVHGE